jgi:hypothetical protein
MRQDRNAPVILSRRSAAKDLELRDTRYLQRILSSFAVFAAQDDGWLNRREKGDRVNVETEREDRSPNVACPQS